MNQYQTDLYGLGIELVHVLGHRRGATIKNAVDVKMAVDAVSLMASLPHIDVYVIVSGDRDFIHVLKELRRHGKTVVGVSPNSAVSGDFSSLCDRFLRYEALTSAVAPDGVESMEEVRAKLGEIVGESRRSAGLGGQDDAAQGAVLQLRREHVRFPELRELPRQDEQGGAHRPRAGDRGRPAGLPGFRDRAVRRGRSGRRGAAGTVGQAEGDALRTGPGAAAGLLARLCQAMAAHAEPFTLNEVHESMQEAGPGAPAFGDIVKYARALYMGGALAVVDSQDGMFFRDRGMSLTLDPVTAESLVLAYETAVATRVVATAGETPVDAASVCVVLGLDSASPDDLGYCGGVLDAAKRQRGSC